MADADADFVYLAVYRHVYTESAEYTKPRKRRYLAKPPSHVPGQWPGPKKRAWRHGRAWKMKIRALKNHDPCVEFASKLTQLYRHKV